MKIDSIDGLYANTRGHDNVSSRQSDQARVQQVASVELEGAKLTDVVAQVDNNASDALPVKKEQLVEAVEKVNQYAKIQHVNLMLEMDEDAGEMVVKVVDRETEEMIRQIPSEHALELAKHLDDVMQQFFSEDPEHLFNLLNDTV